MIKKVLKWFAIILGTAILVAALGIYYFSPSKDTVLNFIAENPTKSAILLVRNDSVLAQQNMNKVMPLASTVKIIVAIEYAEQAAEGLVTPEAQVNIAELEKFYVPDTDGGAHAAWLISVKDEVKNNKIALKEIAKGMIEYSSNANTEWLMEKLGLQNINTRIQELGLQHHTPIYYIVSALFVGKEAFPKLKGNALQEQLKKLSIADYIRFTNAIHKKLSTDTAYKKKLGDLTMGIQKIWSDRLPSSTVSDYVSIMKKINSRNYFNPSAQKYLDEIMEYILENPANREWLHHCGMKGGSTAFVLTKALYAEDKKGNKTELAYFLNNLSSIEQAKLQMSMNEFELNILTNENFLRRILKTLAK